MKDNKYSGIMEDRRGSLNGRKSSLLGDFNTSHPLDNIQNDLEQEMENTPMMSGKSGVLNDSKMVNFGKSRKQILARVNKNKEKTIYSKAVAGNEDEVYELLCKEVVDVNERNPNNGRTILHEAAANGHLTLAQMLIEEFGANVNCRTYLGKETPLHLAVSSNLRPMVYLLLNYGADPNIQSKYLCSPLHYVQKRSIAALLCRNGAIATLRNAQTHTPVQVVIAEQRGEDLVDFLMKINEGQEKDEYKREIEANKAMRQREREAIEEQLKKKREKGKLSFKEKAMRDYEKWRNGDELFLNEIERRKQLRRTKPNEYFPEKEEPGRKKPPKDWDPAA